MESKWFKEKAYLEQAILVDKLSYEEIGRKYGCSGSNIKKVAQRIGIELPQRRKVNPNETFNKGTGQKYYCINCGKEITYPKKFCDFTCQHEYQHKQKYQLILDGDKSILRANYPPSIF